MTDRFPRPVMGGLGLDDAIEVFGMDHHRPQVGLFQEFVLRVSEHRLHLGAHVHAVIQTVEFALDLVHVGDGGNLLDQRPVLRLCFPELRAKTMQFHPEAGPGPHDGWPALEGWVAELRAA